MGTVAVSCEPVRGLGSWLLAYVAVLSLIVALLIFAYPPSFQVPDICLTFPTLFIIFPLVMYLAHDMYVKKAITQNTVTLERIRTSIIEIEASIIKEKGAHLRFADEEFVNRFHRDCAPYVRHVLRERKE